jgi:hypothetical protein
MGASSFSSRQNSGMGMILDVDSPSTPGIYINVENDSITDSKDATWSPTTPMSRSAPLLGYDHSGSRNVGFSCVIAAHDGDAIKVKKNIQFLKSFVYPDYSGEFIRPPHRIYFSYGPSVSIIGVVPSVNVTWHTMKDNSGYCIVAKVSMSITEIRDTNILDYLDARIDDGNYSIKGFVNY